MTKSKHHDWKLRREQLASVQFVPPTPFDAEGESLRVELLGELSRRLVDAGARVLLPAAGTGEFHSLSAAEAIACIRATREAVGTRAIVIAPVGLSLAHAIEVGRGAADCGADGLLVMPPVHPYVGDAGFRDYFLSIAKAVPLPLLTYKRGPAPSDKVLLELADEGSLIGVKYAVNDMDAFARFVDENRGRLGLYCGTAERFAPFFMLAGAEGYTSGAGCICPRVTLALHRAWQSGQYVEAMKWMRLIRPIEDARARDGESFNISLIKYGVELTGLPFGPPRPPQRRLSYGEKQCFAELLAPILDAEEKLARDGS